MLNEQIAFASVTLLLLSVCRPAPAQNIFGAILGNVRDPSGAPVANAAVVATNIDTNQPFRTATSDSGYYEFPLLRPGNYSLRAGAPGFKTSERPKVELRVDDRTRFDFKLEIGPISSSVSVREKIPPVQSESSSLGDVVNGRSVREMPLAGRNVFEAAALAAGVMVNPTAEGRFIAEGGFDSSDISIGGGRYRTNEFLIDGVTVMLPQNNNQAITPTPEGTQEVKVMTGNNGAEFGRTGGGVINVITKGGTNEFHGDGWEFYRNELLEANDFFSNERGLPRGQYNFQMFGGTFGGPIRKDRTFLFAEYQGSRDYVNGGSGTYTFPTAAERQGDFSGAVTSGGVPVTIYDPFTTMPTAGGKSYTRAPFPGNRVPQNRIDPAAAKLMPYIPPPTGPGRGPAHLFNYAYTNQSQVNTDQGSMRIDERFSDRHSLFARVTRNVARFDDPPLIPTIADSAGDNQVQAYVNAVVNGTYIFSPASLLNYRFGLTRKIQNDTPTFLGQIKLTALGFPADVAANAQMQLFPLLSFDGYSSVGTSPPRRVSNDIYNWAADYTRIYGRHTIKIGADVRVYNQDPFNASQAGGSYSFTSAFTQGPNPLVAATGSGDGIASFLTGYGTGSIVYEPAFAIRNAYYGLYVNDDIRLGRLTINAGLRWDYEQPRTERYNRFANFDFARRFPAPVAGMPGLKGVLTQAGQEGYSRGQFDAAEHNLGPQLGLAYRLRSTTAIRAAFGIVYSPRIGYTNSRNFGASGAELTTQWVSSLDGVTPHDPLSNPFPNGIFVQSSNEADRRLMGQALTITDRNSMNDTYMEQWNFSVEQGLPDNWTLEAAYMGSTGVHLPLAVQFNQLDPAYQSLKAGLNKQVANPFHGFVSTGPLALATVAQGQLLRPFPQYLNISTFIETEGVSQYHSLNLTGQKRFSHGFLLTVAYSAGKTIDDGAGRVLNITGLQPPIQNQYDLRAERSLSQQDVSQRLVINHSVDLPFGKGKALLNHAPRLVNALVGGWTLSGDITFQTGFPLWLSSVGNSGVYSAVQRPNNIGRSATLSGAVESRLNQFFNTSVFTVPDPFTFGNTGRALPDTRGPGRRNYNCALSRNIPITERFTAIIRGEAYDLTNTPYFNFPGTKLGANSLGIISSSYGGRQFQLSAKVQW